VERGQSRTPLLLENLIKFKKEKLFETITVIYQVTIFLLQKYSGSIAFGN
jgi:hypothetical protein